MSSDVDYGPLGALMGTWKGTKGMDISPELNGVGENPYHETVTLLPLGQVTNAEEQTLAVVHYLQVVQRLDNDEVFHHQTGYWMWDSSRQTVMYSASIPRAVTLLAGARLENFSTDAFKFTVKSEAGLEDWGVLQSPFMGEKAKTKAFEMDLEFNGVELRYKMNTTVEIYGKIHEHTDGNILTKVKD